MTTFLPFALALAGCVLATTTAIAHADAKPTVTTGHAASNGLDVYYELRGTGEPLVLLHGGLGAIEMFGGNLVALAQHHQVIAIDLQGHGRTALGTRPMALDAIAEDVTAVLDKLDIKRADVMGYSFGGLTAMTLAIRHPERVKRLVVVSAPFKRDGWHSQVTDGMNQMSAAAAEPMKHAPIYELYAKLAPKPDDWARFVGAMGVLVKQPFDYTAQIAKLPPTLIVIGDADGVKPAHAVEFFALLGGGQHDAGWDGKLRPASQLAILPGLTHYSIFNAPALVAAVEPFLTPSTR